MNIHESVIDLIGHTPLVDVTHSAAALPGGETLRLSASRIVVKLEYFNPAGSAKDRVGLALIEDAEARGVLTKGGTIIEPTSGNTGLGLAMVAALKGYRMILTMPETMSAERIKLARAYGAQVVLTAGAEGMQGAIDKAELLAGEIKGAVIMGQFDNPANPYCHECTTGPEIWQDTDGSVDIFVAGVGTGGTLSGVGRYLKRMKPEVQIIAVEPADSPVLSQGRSGAHGLQGIGAGFVPKTLDTQVYDEVITITTEEAYEAGRVLSKKAGILAGITSGAAFSAAVQVAARPENADKTIVALLPDTGERYLSTELFA